PRRLRELLEHLLLLGRELVGHRYLHLHQLVTFYTVLLHALPLDAEPPARLGAGRNAEHNLLAIHRADAQASAQRGLGEVERDLADDVEPLAMKESIGLHLEGDQEVTGRGASLNRLPLAPHAHTGSGLGAGRHGDVDLPLGAHFPGPAAGRARLRRDPPASPALGARSGYREAALAEGDGAPALALGTGGPGSPRSAA